MLRSRRPLIAILSFAFLGALVTVVWRYAQALRSIEAAGESAGSVPFLALVIDVMQLHVHALYGAATGALVGLLVVLVDLVFFRRRPRYEPKDREVSSTGADALIKERRELQADTYLEQRKRDRARREGGS